MQLNKKKMSWKSEANARLVEDICQRTAYRGTVTDRFKKMIGRSTPPSTPPGTPASQVSSLREKLRGIHNCIADSPIDDLFGFIDTMAKYNEMKPIVTELKENATNLLPDSAYKTTAMTALEDMENAKSFLCLKPESLKTAKKVAEDCVKVVNMFSSSFLMDEQVTKAFNALKIDNVFENHMEMNWTFLKDAADMLVNLRTKLPVAIAFFQSKKIQTFYAVLKRISRLSDEAVEGMTALPWKTLKVSRSCRNTILGEYDANETETDAAFREMFPAWKPPGKKKHREELAEFLEEMTVLDFLKGVNKNYDIKPEYFMCPQPPEKKGVSQDPIVAVVDHVMLEEGGKPGSMQQEARQAQAQETGRQEQIQSAPVPTGEDGDNGFSFPSRE